MNFDSFDRFICVVTKYSQNQPPYLPEWHSWYLPTVVWTSPLDRHDAIFRPDELIDFQMQDTYYRSLPNAVPMWIMLHDGFPNYSANPTSLCWCEYFVARSLIDWRDPLGVEFHGLFRLVNLAHLDVTTRNRMYRNLIRLIFYRKKQ